MNKTKIKYLLSIILLNIALTGCSGTYEDYTLGSKLKIFGHAFAGMMFTLSMYSKLYAAILLIELIAMLFTLHEEKKFNFFKHGFIYSCLGFGFIMLFNPFLNTLKWIISFFTF